MSAHAICGTIKPVRVRTPGACPPAADGATNGQIALLGFSEFSLPGWGRLREEDPGRADALALELGASFNAEALDAAPASAVAVLRDTDSRFFVSRAVPRGDAEGLAAFRACLELEPFFHRSTWDHKQVPIVTLAWKEGGKLVAAHVTFTAGRE